MHLLLIEDHAEDARAIERLLKGFSHTLTWCASVEEALALLARASFDCLLLDFFLDDDHTASTVIPSIRELHSSEALPIILLSGAIQHDEALLYLKLDISDFLPKAGLSPGRLWFSIQKACHHAHTLRQLAQERIDLAFERRSRDAFMTTFFDSISDALIFADPTRRMTHFNKAALDLFGYTRSEVLGQTSSMLYADPEAASAQGRQRYNAEAQVSRDRYCIEYVRADGTTFPGETIGGPLRDEDGALIGFVGLIQDITQRLERQRLARAHAQRLQLGNSMLEAVVHATSHSMRSPVLNISRLSEWLGEELGPVASEDIQNYLRLLTQRSEELTAMLDGLRDFVQISAMQLSPEPLSPQDFVDELSGQLPGSFTLSYEGPSSLSTPRVLLGHVLRELVSNAVTHHDREAGEILVRAQAAPGAMRFCVEDDGPGIAPRHQEKVFGLFGRLEKRSPGEGVGKGLAIVQRILIGVGATVRIESPTNQGRGTRFIIELTDDLSALATTPLTS